MKKLLVILCGVLMAANVCLSASDSTTTPEQVMELLNVKYDYSFHPAQYEGGVPDIYGPMTMTLKVKGINLLYMEWTDGHYPDIESAVLFKRWSISCNPDGETKDVVFNIFLWGAWARCGYRSATTSEMIYTPYVWSSDYIDQETMDLYFDFFADIHDINAETEKGLDYSLTGRMLKINGANSSSYDVKIYNFQGKCVMSQNVESSISLSDLTPGFYILSIQDGTSSITSKICLQ